MLEKKNFVVPREVDSNNMTESLPYNEYDSGYVPSSVGLCKQFKRVNIKNSYVSTDVGNNCVVLGGAVVVVRNIILKNNETLLVYQKFCNVQDFFSYPLQSIKIGIYLVSDLSNEMFVGSLSDFCSKNVMLPYKDAYVVFPLLHI